MTEFNPLMKKNEMPFLSGILYVLGGMGFAGSLMYLFYCWDGIRDLPQVSYDYDFYEMLLTLIMRFQLFSTAMIVSLLLIVVGGIIHIVKKC